MKHKPVCPQKLPLKHLKWEEFVGLLGKAHHILGRFDQLLKSVSVPPPITLSLIKELHRAVNPKRGIGAFRRRQNWIGPEGGSMEEGYFFPPRYPLVPRYMNNLKRYINTKEKDSLVQIAIFFAQFLIIHPFMDGNGRVVRALVPILLCNKGLTKSPVFFMEYYFKKHRLKYFESLFAISKHNDWEGWIRFFLKGIIVEGEKQIKKMSSTQKNRAHT